MYWFQYMGITGMAVCLTSALTIDVVIIICFSAIAALLTQCFMSFMQTVMKLCFAIFVINFILVNIVIVVSFVAVSVAVPDTIL